MSQFRHLNRYKLCFVKSYFAYFTTQDLSLQRGDDWDDKTYEHNAGEPYKYLPLVDVDKSPWEVVKVGFETQSYYMKPRHGHENSPYSVDDINLRKECPWLAFKNYNLPEGQQDVELFAGTTLDTFITEIMRAGGNVYFPLREPVVKTEVHTLNGVVSLVACNVPSKVAILDGRDQEASTEPFMCPMGVYFAAG